MSSPDGDQPETKHEFNGKFGGVPSVPLPIKNASREEIDVFVRGALGLTRREATPSNRLS